MANNDCKYHYIIYTNRRGSYITPADKFDCLKFTHSYEIDSPIELTTRKAKLPCPVTKVEDINGVLVSFWKDGRENSDG